MAEVLLDTLRALEVELHQGATRADVARMQALLHPAFFEFGRSGTLWTRQATLDEFAAGGAGPRVWCNHFALQRLSQTLALLTYRSAHVADDGVPYRFTLRASLWEEGDVGWQLRFHQGTPTEDTA